MKMVLKVHIYYILFASYKRSWIGDLLNKLNMIKNRYKNAKIIVFGDFNLKRI